MEGLVGKLRKELFISMIHTSVRIVAS
ncbi:MAG: hypothetical protein ACI8P0_004313, partial [Planctomycetaceae bacterium]